MARDAESEQHLSRAEGRPPELKLDRQPSNGGCLGSLGALTVLVAIVALVSDMPGSYLLAACLALLFFLSVAAVALEEIQFAYNESSTQEAVTVVERIFSGEQIPFYLLLRSHEEFLVAAGPGSNDLVNIEAALRKGLDHELLGVGVVGDMRQASIARGRHSQSWRDDIVFLADRSRGIVIIPGCTPGVVEEINSILDGEHFRSKTLFVMPPLPDEAPWREAQAAIRAAGSNIRLPPYDSRGGFFTVHADGSPTRMTNFYRTLFWRNLGLRFPKEGSP